MHRHRITWVGLSSAAALAFALSCASGEADFVPLATPADSGASTVDAATPDDGGVHTDAQVIEALLTVNTGEVEQGLIAQAQGARSDVLSLAAVIVAEHGSSSERLEALAQQLGTTPQASAVSQELQTASDAITARLRPLTGVAFDEEYITAQIVEHTNVLALIDSTLLPAALDAALRGEVAALRDTMTAHLSRARQIQSTLVSDAGVDAAITIGTAR